MVVSPRYLVPAALVVVVAVLLSPLLRADEASKERFAREMQQGAPLVAAKDATGSIGGARPVLVPKPQSCINDWSEAGPIVRREGLATMEQVGRLARDKASLEIVTSALCHGESGFIYRLRVRGGHDGGKAALKTLFVDARRPFGP